MAENYREKRVRVAKAHDDFVNGAPAPAASTSSGGRAERVANAKERDAFVNGAPARARNRNLGLQFSHEPSESNVGGRQVPRVDIWATDAEGNTVGNMRMAPLVGGGHEVVERSTRWTRKGKNESTSRAMVQYAKEQGLDPSFNSKRRGNTWHPDDL